MTTASNASASGIETRAAALTPSTINETERTVDMVVSAGATVRRYDYRTGEIYDEVLIVSSAAVVLDRMNSGAAPILDSHAAWSMGDALGTVVAGSARIEKGQLIATARFGEGERIEPVWRNVRNGTFRNVSVGYRILAFEVDETTNPKTRRITKWEPYEVSVVPVGADAAAGFRNFEGIPYMTTTPAAAPVASPAPAADPLAAQRQVEMDRIDHIRSRAAQLNLPDEMVRTAISSGQSIDAFNRAVIDHLADAPSNQRNINPHIQVLDSWDDPGAIRGAMVDALAHRLAPSHVKLQGQATVYRGQGALALFGQLLAARGIKINPWDRDALITRAVGAHTTSDFVELLAAASNKALEAQYEAAAPTYRMIAAQKPFSDFKDHRFLRLGDFPTFKKLNESGEVQYGSISESRETVTPAEFATGIAISRRALMNDDLGALADFTSLIAIRAAQFENSQVYDLVKDDGPTLSDGKTLFHADHRNKAASGTAIANGIDAAVQAIRAMTGLDGAKLNLRPRYLVVGPAQEANGRRILAQINPTTAGDVNPWAGQFELVVDAEVSGNRWHVVAEPAQVPTLVYGYVNDTAGPQILTETDFDTQAVKVRAGLDFAAGVIDYRGVYCNDGAAS